MNELKEAGITLSTFLIPALRSEGIRFQFVDSVHPAMKILVMHKNISICKIEAIQGQNGYYYKVTWAHTRHAIRFLCITKIMLH